MAVIEATVGGVVYIVKYTPDFNEDPNGRTALYIGDIDVTQDGTEVEWWEWPKRDQEGLEALCLHHMREVLREAI